MVQSCKIWLSFTLLLVCIVAHAQVSNIVVELQTPDTVTGAVVFVHQDERLLHQLVSTQSASTTTTKGYRVQLFSSNVPKKGKDAAFRVEKNVLAKYSDFAIYVTYVAPFWKVRVGDCMSYDDAVTLRAFMMKEFPEYQSEIYIVPDQINIPSNE